MIMSLNIGTPKNINFPFATNGKIMVLGVPILKHFRVSELFCAVTVFGRLCEYAPEEPSTLLVDADALQ